MDRREADHKLVVVWRKQYKYAIVQVDLNTIFEEDGHYYIESTFLDSNTKLIPKSEHEGKLCIIPADNKLMRKLYSSAVKNRFYTVSFPVTEVQEDEKMLIALPDINNLFMTLHPRGDS